MRLFSSQLGGRPVLGTTGERLGRLRDVVVGLEEPGYPPVRGLVVRAGTQDRFVSIRDVAALDGAAVRLRCADLPAGAFRRRDGEVLLEHDLVDRQLLDVRGARVVRANDVEVGEMDGCLCLVGIDISARGLLRRLGPRRLVGGLAAETIDWAVVEPLASQVPEVRLRLRHDQLAKLHPADIARIIDSLAYPQEAEVLQALDDATAADTLEEIEAGRQKDILEALPAERAADILEEMAPDAAADALGDLPRAEAADLMARMSRAESREVERLLRYPRDSAGGIMTTQFVIALEHETTRQAVAYLRRQIEKPDLVSSVYVVDNPDDRWLLGVVSLRDLLLAGPDQPLHASMRRDLRTVHPEATAGEAARLMTEYNLLALPVVDQARRLLGLVTADDALELLLPASLKRHLPRLFR